VTYSVSGVRSGATIEVTANGRSVVGPRVVKPEEINANGTGMADSFSMPDFGSEAQKVTLVLSIDHSDMEVTPRTITSHPGAEIAYSAVSSPPTQPQAPSKEPSTQQAPGAQGPGHTERTGSGRPNRPRGNGGRDRAGEAPRAKPTPAPRRRSSERHSAAPSRSDIPTQAPHAIVREDVPATTEPRRSARPAVPLARPLERVAPLREAPATANEPDGLPVYILQGLAILTVIGLAGAVAIRLRRAGPDAQAVIAEHPPDAPDGAVEAELQEILAEERAAREFGPERDPPVGSPD
jgi:hypothetical protein